MAFDFSACPQEIIDRFVDEFAFSEDRNLSRSHLRTCLLISRSFCHRSRQHLFKTITVSNTPFDDNKAKLDILFDVIGHGVAPYVNNFEVHLDPEVRASLIAPQDSIHKGISKIFDALLSPDYGPKTLLIQAKIRSNETYPAIIEWTDLGSALQISLSALLGSSNLENLTLIGLDELPPMILNHSHLKGIILERTRFVSVTTGTTSGENNGYEAFPSLETLKVLSDATLGKTLENGSNSLLRQLRSLEVDVGVPRFLDKTWDLKLQLYPSVEKLTLIIHDFLPRPKHSFNLGQFPGLKHLRFNCSYFRDPEESAIEINFGHPLDKICGFLKVEKIARSLRTIHLSLSTCFSTKSKQFLKAYEKDSRWLLFDDILSDENRFPSLQKVTLDLGLQAFVRQKDAIDEFLFQAEVQRFFGQVSPKLTSTESDTRQLVLKITPLLRERAVGGETSEVDEPVEQFQPPSHQLHVSSNPTASRPARPLPRRKARRN